MTRPEGTGRRYLALLALVAMVSACTGSGHRSAASSQLSASTPITIGVLADVSGEDAVGAAEIHLNVDLAVAQANINGGVDGRQIRAIYADPRADPTLAVSLAEQMVQQNNASVLLGGVGSPECLALAQEAPKLGVVYLAASGCPTPDLTAAACNGNSFRILPIDAQLIPPLAKYLVSTYGKRWAAIYPNYAFGQSELASYQTAIAALGGTISVEIPIPVGETDVTAVASAVAGIPTDGSIDGVLNLEDGTDLARVDDALQQSGLGQRLPIAFSGNKENFGGVYPDAVNGFVFATVHPSTPQPDNQYDQNYAKAFQAQAIQGTQYAAVLGAPGKAVSGALGYQAYAAMSALISGMQTAKFTGKGGTAKLIAALESLNAPLGPEFPAGPVEMNRLDHQGRAQIFIEKVDGQQEDLLQTVPSSDVPDTGVCSR